MKTRNGIMLRKVGEVLLLLFLVLIAMPEMYSMAVTLPNDLRDISIRSKSDTPLPGTENEYYYNSIRMNEILSNDKLNYTAAVDYSVSSVKVVASSSGSSTVTGTGIYNLNVGDNTIQINVNQPGGNIKTYTIVITRNQNPDEDNRMYWFEIKDSNNSTNKLKFTPDFSSEVTSYYGTVPNEVKNVNMTYKTVNGFAGKDYTLKTGENKIEVPITSKNGIVRTYTFVINREKFSNADIYDLHINGKDISPNENNSFYTEVPYGISTLQVTASIDSTAKGITGLDVGNLKVGLNKYNLAVTAEDGSVKKYVLTIKRNNPSAKLEYIDVNQYSCSGDENPYELEVDNSTKEVDIYAKAEDPTCKVTGNGTYKLKVGVNKFYINVKAKTGLTKKYTVIVKRSKYEKVIIYFYWVIKK